MKSCDKEDAVRAALRQGEWEESLRAHVEDCPACNDLMLVTQYLETEARTARHEADKNLPSPGLIWWKAEILAKRTASERATRPIAIFEKVAYAVGSFGLLGFLAWNWSAFDRWLAPLESMWAQMSSMGATPLLNPFLYLSAGFFMLVLMTIFAVYVLWAES
jgi:hypothetical protein